MVAAFSVTLEVFISYNIDFCKLSVIIHIRINKGIHQMTLDQLITRNNYFANEGEAFPTDKSQLSGSQIDSLLEDIEAHLSPENLHCDGEISYKQAMRKKAQLMAAQSELYELKSR